MECPICNIRKECILHCSQCENPMCLECRQDDICDLCRIGSIHNTSQREELIQKRAIIIEQKENDLIELSQESVRYELKIQEALLQQEDDRLERRELLKTEEFKLHRVRDDIHKSSIYVSQLMFEISQLEKNSNGPTLENLKQEIIQLRSENEWIKKTIKIKLHLLSTLCQSQQFLNNEKQASFTQEPEKQKWVDYGSDRFNRAMQEFGDEDEYIQLQPSSRCGLY